MAQTTGTTDRFQGIFQGSSILLLGSMNPDDNTSLRVPVEAGGVVVLPAGTAHSSMDSSPDYRSMAYAGLVGLPTLE
ncbi:hypothetical protein SCAR479_07740 [Seiridium cardinale]|uniref:Uncharacterized protein n=1 Tax=Seiridium cardinale TaxID=138064 RepID=A0ABR2XPB5_9PEZI